MAWGTLSLMEGRKEAGLKSHSGMSGDSDQIVKSQTRWATIFHHWRLPQLTKIKQSLCNLGSQAIALSFKSFTTWARVLNEQMYQFKIPLQL